MPGWTLPGVMTTGCAQTLLRADRTIPAGRVVIAGHGPLNLQLAYELSRAGATVAAVVEASSPTSPRGMGPLAAMARTAPGLLGDGMRYLLGLRRAGISVRQGHVLVGVEGTDRVEAARIARIDESGRVVPGSEQRLEADTICLNYGFQPASELSRLLGCRHHTDPATGALVPEQGKNGATSVPGVWIAGDGGSIGGARVALAQGRLAALAALEELGHDTDPGELGKVRKDLDRALRFQKALWTLFAAPPLDPLRLMEDANPVVCRCEEVRLGQLRRHLGRWPDAGVLKRLTRIGMGRCQGRYCAPVLGRLLGDAGEGAGFAPQRPARPVPVVALLREQGEWSGHPAVTPRPPLAGKSLDEPVDLQADVAVIGAGILGVATALALVERGIDTVLIERGQPNGQASGGNAGSLHVQLLAYDLKDRERIAEQPVASLLPLQRHATRVWQEVERGLGVDLEIEVTGGLMLAESQEQLLFLERKAAVEKANGIEVEILGRDELRRIFPDVAPSMIGASLCPAEGKINPLLATPALLAAAQARGVRLVTHAAVEAIETHEPGFCLRTSRGTVQARRLVDAAGASAGHIAALAGVHLPVRAVPLQMLVTEAAPPVVRHLVAHADRHLTMKQARTGQLIIGGGWSGALHPVTGQPTTLTDKIAGNLWVAERVLPALAGLHLLRSWATLSGTTDGAPVLGEAPGRPGFYALVTANGYTNGPLLGRLMADLIVGRQPDLDIRPYAPGRFAT